MNWNQIVIELLEWIEINGIILEYICIKLDVIVLNCIELDQIGFGSIGVRIQIGIAIGWNLIEFDVMKIERN